MEVFNWIHVFRTLLIWKNVLYQNNFNHNFWVFSAKLYKKIQYSVDNFSENFQMNLTVFSSHMDDLFIKDNKSLCIGSVFYERNERKT